MLETPENINTTISASYWLSKGLILPHTLNPENPSSSNRGRDAGNRRHQSEISRRSAWVRTLKLSRRKLEHIWAVMKFSEVMKQVNRNLKSSEPSNFHASFDVADSRCHYSSLAASIQSISKIEPRTPIHSDWEASIRECERWLNIEPSLGKFGISIDLRVSWIEDVEWAPNWLKGHVKSHRQRSHHESNGSRSSIEYQNSPRRVLKTLMAVLCCLDSWNQLRRFEVCTFRSFLIADMKHLNKSRSEGWTVDGCQFCKRVCCKDMSIQEGKEICDSKWPRYETVFEDQPETTPNLCTMNSGPATDSSASFWEKPLVEGRNWSRNHWNWRSRKKEAGQNDVKCSRPSGWRIITCNIPSMNPSYYPPRFFWLYSGSKDAWFSIANNGSHHVIGINMRHPIKTFIIQQ